MELLYRNWNSKINVISRKDIGHFTLHHLIHSLSIGSYFSFLPGTTIMDAGTGGGFPGLPLAIMFPEVHFTLVDSIGKKIMVINEITRQLGLTNITAVQERFEKINQQFDFVTGRAVSNMASFYSMVRLKIKKQENHPFRNGILYLTGGDVQQEVASIGKENTVIILSERFPEEYFTTKKLVHIFV